MIDQLVSLATQKLGISEGQARQATGGLMGLIKDKADGDDFAALEAQIPGAAAIADEAPAGDGGGGGGGLMGGLMGAASGLMGGGGGADLLGMLGKSGLGPADAGGFASLAMGFLKEKLSGDLLQSIVAKVPMLAKFLG